MTEEVADRISPDEIADKLTPLDLREYNGPLYVQHMNPSSTLIAESVDGTERVRLGPFGNREKSDVAMLPRKVAENPSFQRAWRRGTVIVTTDPKMEEILLTADIRQVKEQRARADAILQQTEDPVNELDLQLESCLECGGNVWKSERKLKDEPPLCPSHDHLWKEEKFRYLGTPERDEDGKLVTKWSKIAA